MSSKISFNLLAAITFIAGLISSLTVNQFINDFDKYHWLIILPIIFPIGGLYFGVLAALRAQGIDKLIPISILFINICLAVVIFVSYAFSYWQF